MPLNVKILAGAEQERARKTEMRCSLESRHPELNVENQTDLFQAVFLENDLILFHNISYLFKHKNYSFTIWMEGK